MRSLGHRDVGNATPVIWLCVALLTLCLVEPASANNPSLEVSVVPASELPEIVGRPYEIQVGDVLDINFFKVTDLDQERTVGPDGEIFLPLVGRVEVLHRTVGDVTAELNERYSQEMVNPQITLSVREFSGLQVYVGGEVNDPGIVTYQGKLTLVQALMEAGGHTKRARLQQVLLIRRGPDDQPVGALVDVKRILRKGQFEEDVQLAPLDTVYVHHKKVINVNIFMQQYISDNLPRFGSWFWWFPEYRGD